MRSREPPNEVVVEGVGLHSGSPVRVVLRRRPGPVTLGAAGFEARHVESLREHYALTLRAWVHNLEAAWDAAVAQVGPARARIWRLYMAGCAVGFEDGGVQVHQVLAVRPGAGASGMRD